MSARFRSQSGSFFETTGRSVQLMRLPTSWVVGSFGAALMWHVAQVGAAV